MQKAGREPWLSPGRPHQLSRPLARGGERCNRQLETLELASEESGEGGVPIIAEWTARGEAVTRVKSQRSCKGLSASGFEAEASVTAASGLAYDMGQHQRAYPTAKRLRRGSHRLHFAVIGREFLECADADQAPVVTRRPEGHRRVPQPVEGEHVAGLRRRSRLHLFEMESQQIDDVGAVEIAFVKGE